LGAEPKIVIINAICFTYEGADQVLVFRWKPIAPLFAIRNCLRPLSADWTNVCFAQSVPESYRAAHHHWMPVNFLSVCPV